MADRTIYTRAYSKNSAGQLTSAKAPKGDPLSDTTLLQEFRNHAEKWNEEPTALVSASDRIVDTLKRAFEHYENGESPADIWIVFVEAPPIMNKNATQIHSARDLAEKCELPEPNRFYHEVVFEWTIPNEWVMHKVSLQTLMERGLQEHVFSESSTMQVRRDLGRRFQEIGPWEIGVYLGFFARKFGARAPLNWISHRLFRDCVRAKILDDDVVQLQYAHGCCEIVDFNFFCDMDDGIDTSLFDWWLLDIDLLLDYEEFEEWKCLIEDSTISDLIEFWETWHSVNHDGTTKELSASEQLLYEKEENKLLVNHEKERAAVEREAVKIGL
jgi:hypothetical protein